MLVKLSHPNILQCFGTSEGPDGSLYQILEFCGGGTLPYGDARTPMVAWKVLVVAADLPRKRPRTRVGRRDVDFDR